MFLACIIAGISLLAVQCALVILLIVQHSKRKASELQLGELNRYLINAQEEERKRIARELHDDFGQRLALLKIGFEMLLNQDPALKDKTTFNRLTSIHAEIEELSSNIRQLSHRLHSSKLQYTGLKPALKELCEQVEQQYHVAIILEADVPGKAVSEEIELCIYRVAQEALHNIAIHSQATRVLVDLVNDGTALLLEISDDGKGFDPAHGSQGLGLASMRERLGMIGGDLHIKSTPGYGTVLSARAPVAKSSNSILKNPDDGHSTNDADL